MLAWIVMTALLGASQFVDEGFEDLETQEEIIFFEDENEEELALNEELEYQDLNFSEEANEVAEELLDENE